MGQIGPKRPLDTRSHCRPYPPEYGFARYGYGSASNRERAMNGSQAITEEAARAIGVERGDQAEHEIAPIREIES